MEDDAYAEHPNGFFESSVAVRDGGEDFIAPQVAFEERTMAKLFEEIVNSSERSVTNQLENMRSNEGGRNALDKFRDGRLEFLGYGIARIYDLLANGNQGVRTAFCEAQRGETIRLGRESSVGLRREWDDSLTSTNWTASQIFSMRPPTSSNPGTGANRKRSTPAKSASWPTSAAKPRTPPMASITR